MSDCKKKLGSILRIYICFTCKFRNFIFNSFGCIGSAFRDFKTKLSIFFSYFALYATVVCATTLFCHNKKKQKIKLERNFLQERVYSKITKKSV